MSARRRFQYRYVVLVAALLVLGAVLSAGVLFARRARSVPREFSRVDQASVANPSRTLPSSEEVMARKALAQVEASMESAPTSRSAAGEDVAIRGKLKRLKECWSQEDSCEFVESDPRSRHFEIVAQVKSALRSLVTLKLANPDADFSSDAREWLMSPDDHVREVALELLGQHDRSRENLQALVVGLSASLSGPLLRRALTDLRDFQQAGFDREVSGFLAEFLRSGPLKAGEAVADGILPLVRETNENIFTEAARALPPGSRSRRALEAALDEFRRMRAGG
ncbi:MAG: hypothetical protein NDI61_04530 [Bdellovibrionaceae bacterium]|nr:hypothetical protein [Pseudobdellovibrionaceae bacterium]